MEVTPVTPGLHALRAQAVVRPQAASAGEEPAELRTRVFEQVLPCGGPGAVFVEQSESALWIGTDRHSVQLPLRPSRDWAVSFGVVDRATEERILSHSVSIGPPFVPSVLATCTWTARVEREAGSVTATLSTSPPTLPGLTFERVLRISASGLIQLVYRVLNAGPGERPITVDAGTSVRLGMVSGTQVAAPLATGLVVQDAADFPDWEEPDLARPERYAESWMAEFGGGWVGATMWQGAKEVFAGWRSPSLTFDLGTVPPGGQAETPPLYLYAGTGDWKSVRALWRRLIDPQAPAQDPLPRPAYGLRLERFAFDVPSEAVETRLLLESELGRGMSGRAAVEVSGEEVAGAGVEGLRAGAPQSVPVRLALPQRAGALPATLVFDHEREEERQQAALLRAGRAGTEVRLSQQGEGRETRVTLQNGRLRLTVQPGVMARLLELSVPGGAPTSAPTDSGEWVNQLHAADPAPGTFVWYNPWYGGVHPVLSTGRGWGNTTRLEDETFTWEPVEAEGAQGVRWHGVSASALATSRHLAGLHLTVTYLLVGDGNMVAVRQKVENRSGARVRGSLSMTTFLQPGGDRTKGILAYEDGGRLRRYKRVHGGNWVSPSGWCAVARPGWTGADPGAGHPRGYTQRPGHGPRGGPPGSEHRPGPRSRGLPGDGGVPGGGHRPGGSAALRRLALGRARLTRRAVEPPGSRMRIVYSPRHTRHRPRTELLYGKPVEHPERPERVEAVRAALEGTRWAGAVVPPREYPLSLAESVHQPAYVRHLRTRCALAAAGGPDEEWFPYVFPYHRGMDTGTPLMGETLDLAWSSASVALTGADLLRAGEARVVYALCRPPGHHAGAGMSGGYCYLNNAALAARRLLAARRSPPLGPISAERAADSHRAGSPFWTWTSTTATAPRTSSTPAPRCSTAASTAIRSGPIPPIPASPPNPGPAPAPAPPITSHSLRGRPGTPTPGPSTGPWSGWPGSGRRRWCSPRGSTPSRGTGGAGSGYGRRISGGSGSGWLRWGCRCWWCWRGAMSRTASPPGASPSWRVFLLGGYAGTRLRASSAALRTVGMSSSRNW